MSARSLEDQLNDYGRGLETTFNNELDLYKDKFDENVLLTKGCWFWQGSSVQEPHGEIKGYIKIGKKRRAVTRISWELFRGEIPEQMQIRQICKHDLCVNPGHLELIRQSYGRI